MFKIFGKIGLFFLDLIETIVMAMAVFVIIYLFLFQPHQVRGNSMYPNFHDNEYILTDKVSYRLGEPKRGDVIIFKAPKSEEYDYIKRIIALPGESVRIEQNKIYINDQLLGEDYIPQDYITYPGAFLQRGETLGLGPDEYFVMGDNRLHSSDSRDWGFVPDKNIIGKAWLRYWPPERFGILKEVQYKSLSYNSFTNLLQPLFCFDRVSLKYD